MKILKKICVFIGAFLLYHVLFSNLFPADENGYLNAPDWYYYLGLAISLGVVFSDSIKKKWRKRRSITMPLTEPVTVHNIEPVIPEHNISVPVIEPIVVPDEELIVPRNTMLITSTQPHSILERIDAMDGHAFEYWCADLLRDNGFINVSVTRGSGDQGVDILAEKEGIRYAIQCKCYSSDLGNTPIQEVYTGKSVYRCHIGAVMTNRYFTKGAKEAAKATDVLLWDRSWIKAHLTEKQDERSFTSLDHLIWDVLDFIHNENCTDIDRICHHLGLGYARTSRILDQLEELGYVGPFRGSQPREIIR